MLVHLRLQLFISGQAQYNLEARRPAQLIDRSSRRHKNGSFIAPAINRQEQQVSYRALR